MPASTLRLRRWLSMISNSASITGLTIATAGWSIPRAESEHFPPEGSSLQRYASRFGGVEVNSSFHRPHRRSTWERWADSVAEDFAFSVKMPREISHNRKLHDCAEVLAQFLGEVEGLGAKLRVLLLQLPPSLAFADATARDFLRDCAARTAADIVCEPRHATWFEAPADEMLADLRVARVAADPARVPSAADPGGWRGLTYLRLHGSPNIYRSAYGEDRLRGYAGLLAADRSEGRSAWCVFDNTASSAAITDARRLTEMLGPN